jgi:hypothetical protein
MNCISCSNSIETERLEVLPETKICSCCAKIINPSRNKGVMCFENKTGGFMQTIDPETYKDWQYYNPYGRATGRGSGVHRVMSSSER